MPLTPANDTSYVQSSDREREREVDRDKERDRTPKSKQSTKVKDLSHVPCKFFKVGACTAGSSCPFSHILQEPGGHKEVCAWFIKGNCKFGHKCALAHVLPGQNMAMDRKNKKAAQVAANNAIGAKDGSKGGKGPKKESKPAGGYDGSSSALSSPGRNPLLSGSTAPTRVLPPSSRPPLPVPLKASISPSVPAPPLKDTDFPSFGLPDDDDKFATEPIESKSQPRFEPLPPTENALNIEKVGMSAENLPLPTTAPLPLSTPSAKRRPPGSPSPIDFGPIGSPPRSIAPPGKQSRLNGGSPGSSPSYNPGFTSSSPFSAPGTQTVFLSRDIDGPTDAKGRSGIAASLGANRAWMADFTPVPAKSISRTNLTAGPDIAVEDEDLEDFLPSSLTDLLTVEERSRRMSRSNSGQRAVTITRDSSGQRSNVDSPHHRYSRSVPAPSLLSDIQSIWSDNGPGATISPEMNANNASLAFAIPGNRLGSGTPSSFKSSGNAFGGRSFNDDTFPPAVPPSNASAAFLPGLHHHYLSAKASNQHPNVGRNTSSITGLLPNTRSANPFTTVTSTGIPLSPPQLKSMVNHLPLDSVAADAIQSRPIPGNTAIYGGEPDERRNALSPSTRALQAHAPGQSLPQGLAAGYSRIHALPPPPMISSPSASGTFNPKSSIYSPNTNGHDWPHTLDSTAAAATPGMTGVGVTSPMTNAGLESVFSQQLSYSTAASRMLNSTGSTASPIPSGAVAPGMARNVSGRSWQTQGPFSPLSGPVRTGDDDDLFSMDG